MKNLSHGLSTYEREKNNNNISHRLSLDSGEWVEFNLNVNKSGEINEIIFKSTDNPTIKKVGDYLSECLKNNGPHPFKIKKVRNVERSRRNYLIKYEKIYELLNISEEKSKKLAKLVVKTINHCFDIWQYRNARTFNIFKKLGLFYNLKRTLLVYFIFFILQWVTWLYGGLWGLTPYVISEIILFSTVFPIALIVFTILVKGIYTGLKDITFGNSEGIKKIFNNDYYFERNRWMLDRRSNPVYFLTLWIGIVALITIWFIFIAYWEDIINAILRNNWLIIIGLIINITWWSLFCGSALVVTAQIFNISITIAQIERRTHHLNIIVINDFNFERLKSKGNVVFIEFYESIREFGLYIFKIMLYSIIIVTCLTVVFFNSSPETIFLLIVTAVSIICLLVYLLIGIRYRLKKLRNEMIKSYETIFNIFRLELFSLIESKDPYNEKPINQFNFIKELVKELENRLVKRAENLKKSEKRINSFLDSASHEIKSPLQYINLGISNALENISKLQNKIKMSKNYSSLDMPLKELEDQLKDIQFGSNTLRDTINTYLDYSLLESDNILLNREKANIILLLNKAINLNKYLLEDRNITIIKDFPDEAYIMIDKGYILHVFTNLISNSIKYSPKGSEVQIDCKNSEKSILITIKDKGAGFTSEELKKIFTKFGKFKRKKSFLTDGLGIGLYIIRKGVTLHGGNIWVESKGRNLGSKFFIEFPLIN